MTETVCGTNCRATITCLVWNCRKKNRIWGQSHLRYLKKHHRVLYGNLLTSGKLNGYLVDIDRQAEEMFERLVKQMAEREGVTEQLKAANSMEWVRKMNSIRYRSVEITNSELIYA